MSKPIAIAFSDLHIHKFNQFNTPVDGINGRLFESLTVMNYIANIAHKYNVPLLFCGDLFENPDNLENETGSLSLYHYKEFIEKRGLWFFAISGNHDLKDRNGLVEDSNSPSHLWKFKVFERFKLLDRYNTIVTKKFAIQGVPYMDNDADTLLEIHRKAELIAELKHQDKYKEPCILLLHQDFPGAKTPAGFECKEYHALNTNLDKLFEPWDFVLCGHIHKPQRIAKNAWMLGSPIQQITSDEGTKMGYWKIYADRKPKLIPLNDIFPEFRTLKKNETPDNTKDYFLELPQSNLVEKESKINDFHINNSRDKLAISYLKHRGIKNKTKIKALKKILSEI